MTDEDWVKNAGSACKRLIFPISVVDAEDRTLEAAGVALAAAQMQLKTASHQWYVSLALSMPMVYLASMLKLFKCS